MQNRVIMITGAAGFLAAAVTVDLARHHSIVAIDRRLPSSALIKAAPSVTWRRVDIAHRDSLAGVFRETKERFARIDLVIHFAAFYHSGLGWRREYQQTNVLGTESVLQLAIESDVRHLIFASSMIVMLPGAPGQPLTERTPAAEYMPYGRSKAIGERLIKEASGRLRSVTPRIGGVFSDWCELPLLYTLVKLWAGRAPLNRVVLGRGNSGIPYIHRDDLVRLVCCCIARHREFETHEVFLASQHGAVLDNELFHAMHEARSERRIAKPAYVPRGVAKVGVWARQVSGLAARNRLLERPWMLRYLDQPWIADTSYTRAKLDWDCSERLGIRERIPVIVDHFIRERRAWERRNKARNRSRYSYAPNGT